eukprot:m.989891 g.989891  ORF g.989891 m.989891 type:complete len:1244 (-) comp23999_c0_seq3:287-4018(-)
MESGSGAPDALATKHFFTEASEVIRIIGDLRATDNPTISSEKVSAILEKYQEAPNLLDAHLEQVVHPLIDLARDCQLTAELETAVFHILYILTKVRGYKKILKFFSHEASDFHPTVERIVGLEPNNPAEWQKRYILLLWLSLICMLPFNMAVLDSGGAESDVRKIIRACYVYVVVNDKARDAAAILCARLVTRPDLYTALLPEFFAWAKERLETTDVGHVAGMVTLTGVMSALSAVFKLGKRDELLPHADELLRHVERCALATCANTLLRKLTAKLVQRIGLTFLPPRQAAWRYQRGRRTLLAADTSAAVAPDTTVDRSHRPAADGIGAAALLTTGPTDDAEDEEVPEEIETVIELLLTALKDRDTVVRWSAAKGVGRITGRLPVEFADEVVESVLACCTHRESHGAWHGACLAIAELGRRGLLLPVRLPQAMPVVLRALAYDEVQGACSVGAHVRDAACYVAWAFARAYDPVIMKEHVTGLARALVVAAVFDREVNVRRAASAALQENVGRQGTLPNGIAIVTTADYSAVGNRVRAYQEISVHIAQFPQYTASLVQHLCTVKLVHWDVAVRRLAADAIVPMTSRCPEQMARLVQETFVPDSVSVDLNQRHGCILGIGRAIFALSKLGNVDAALVNGAVGVVRELHRSDGFRGMGGEMIRIAVCHMVADLARAKVSCSADDVALLQDHVNANITYDEDEVQDAAVAAFHEMCHGLYAPQLSSSPAPAAPSSAPLDPLRTLAATTVTWLLRSLDTRACPARARRGYAAALGGLPECLLFVVAEHATAERQSRFQEAVDTLQRACVLPATVHLVETEARRQALRALTKLVTRAAASTSQLVTSDDLHAVLPGIYATLFDGMGDYTIDSRGDIGSRVREECMRSLEDLTLALLRTPRTPSKGPGPSSTGAHGCGWAAPGTGTNVVSTFIQQSLEKIDRTRALACRTLARLCAHVPPTTPSTNALGIRHHDALCDILSVSAHSPASSPEATPIDWLVPGTSFPRMIKCLSLEAYRTSALVGLVVSVGGLTESLVKAASAALLAHLEELSEGNMEQFGRDVLTVFKSHAHDERVVIPLLKTMDLLFTHDAIGHLIRDSGDTFPDSLYDHCKAAIHKSANVPKIRSGVDVLCGLIGSTEAVRKRALSTLLVYLCHKYPRVRKFTAEKLYVALLSLEDVFPEDVGSAVDDILTETRWDDDVKEARIERNKICDLLGIPKPKLKAKASTAPQAQVRDDLDSYRDLVDRTGY